MFYCHGTAYGHSPRAGPFRVPEIRHDGVDLQNCIEGLCMDLATSTIIVDPDGRCLYPTVLVMQITVSRGLTSLAPDQTPPRDIIPLPLFEQRLKGTRKHGRTKSRSARSIKRKAVGDEGQGSPENGDGYHE